MIRCRPRALTAHQQMILWHGLTGGYSDKPTRNIVVADLADPEDCSAKFQMVRMGFLEFVRDVPGYRRYDITEAGAAAVGLWLPED